jgi:hypothetical protein
MTLHGIKQVSTWWTTPPGAMPQVMSVADLNRIAGLDVFPTISALAKSGSMRLPIPKLHKEKLY